jgi:hypothetical protein
MTWFVFTVVERLAVEVEELDKHAPKFFAESLPDIASPLELLAKVRAIRQKLHAVEQYIEREAAQRMGQKRVEWQQGFAVRRQTAERTEWLHEDLATAVLTAAVVDENGELPSEEANVLACKVKQAMVDCAGFSYWRVGKLREYGIDVDDFRKRTPGRYVVEVEIADEAA